MYAAHVASMAGFASGVPTRVLGFAWVLPAAKGAA
jgi:hypothetical protein